MHVLGPTAPDDQRLEAPRGSARIRPHLVSTLVSSTLPLMIASTGNLRPGDQSRRRGGEATARALLVTWAYRPGEVDPSAPQRSQGHPVPCESGSPANLLGRDRPPTVSSSLRLSHEQLAPATAMRSPPLLGVARA
jgi:hypothetical protein